MLTAVIAAGLLGLSVGSAAAWDASASRCVRARMGGHARCLAVGQRCSNRYQRVYRLHGFTCSSRHRLIRRRVAPPPGGMGCSGNGATPSQLVAAPSQTSNGTTIYTTVIPSVCVGPSGSPGDFSADVIDDASGQVIACLTGGIGPPPGQADCPRTASPGRMGGDTIYPPSFERGPVYYEIVLQSAYLDGGQIGGTLGSAHVLYRW